MDAPLRDDDDELERVNNLAKEIVNQNNDFLQGVTSTANQIQESRRWLILETLAIVGFIVPLLFDADAALPARATAHWACGVLLAAVIVLFVWDTVGPFVMVTVIRAAHAAGGARLAAVWHREGERSRQRLGFPREYTEERLRELEAEATAAQKRLETLFPKVLRFQTAFAVVAKTLVVIGLALLMWSLLQTPVPTIAPQP